MERALAKKPFHLFIISVLGLGRKKAHADVIIDA
jgi:hypothetical protein